MKRPWNGDLAVTNQPIEYPSGATLPAGSLVRLMATRTDANGLLRWKVIDSTGRTWANIPDHALQLPETP